MAAKLPKLRTDLRITRQKQRGEVVFVVKDPVTDGYYRYSETEYQVMALFDGRHTVDQIIEEFKRIDEDVELDEETVKGFISSLKDDDLFEKSTSEKNLILLEKQRALRKHRLLSAKGSLLYLRFPLLDPNKLLDKTIDYIRFFWTPGFFILSLLTILASYAIIFANWDQIFASLKEMYSFSNQSADNLIRLWIVVIIVIGLHEFGHAYTCKNFGGEVHEMGFLLMIMINPCLYANVNDAWTFPEKSRKLWVTFAGGYFEAFIGALATFAWWVTNPGSTFNTYCYAALTICSVSSIAFNFNPLVKLDGYYALSDYLEIPNLRQRAGDFVSYTVKHHIMRRDAETDEDDPRTQRILLIYGILAKFWITTILLTIFLMFKDMLIGSLHEYGVLLMAGLLSYMFRNKLKALGTKIWKFFLVPEGQLRARKRRNRVSAVLIILITAGFFLQTNVYIKADCHLEPARRVAVRAQVSGFVKTVHSMEGHTVSRGDPLFTLTDPVREGALIRLALDRDISQVNIHQHQGTLNPAGVQEELIRMQQLDETLTTNRQLIEALDIRAPISGTVLTPDLPELTNGHISKGEQLCEIGDLSTMHVVIPVGEKQSGLVDIGDPVEVRVAAYPSRSFSGSVISMSTQADTSAIDRAIQVQLEVANDEQALRTGMQGKARILAHRESWNANIARFLLGTIRMDLWF